MDSKQFYNYLVYEDGSVYSNYSNKFLKFAIVQGYAQYTLAIGGVPKIFKAHRLVAYLFLDVPENYKDLVVNHKDGNKLNNHYSNLEWCTTYYNNIHARVMGLNNISKSNSDRWNDDSFRNRVSKNISKGRKLSGCSKGKNNPKFRYLIFDKCDNEYSRQDLASLLGLSQSRTDALIRKGSNGEAISNKAYNDNGIRIVDTKKS